MDSLRDAILSLVAQDDGCPEIIVVDNASPTEISTRIKAEFQDRVNTVRLEHNSFFCEAVNTGIAIASGPYIAVLNDDCFVNNDWSRHALGTFANDPTLGSVASLVLRRDSPDVIDSAGNHLDHRGLPGNIAWNRLRQDLPIDTPTDVFSAAGSCAVYCARALRAVGAFDARFEAYVDDVDVGFRLQLAGRGCVFQPNAVAFHIGGGTFKARHRALFLTERNMIWNLVKNMPTALLRKYHSDIWRVASRPAPVVGGSTRRAWLSGKLAAGLSSSQMLRDRQAIQQRRRASDSHIEALLTSRVVGQAHL